MALDPHYRPEFNLLADAYLGKKEVWDKKLQYLASIAQSEPWDYPGSCEGERKFAILYNYLNYTYDRVKQENKIEVSPDKKKMCFNTGLQTIHGSDIFAFFIVRDLEKYSDNNQWYFVAFTQRTERRMQEFDSLPEIADYFTDPADFIFDKRLGIDLDYDHIIDDNYDRFIDIGLNDKHIIQALLENAVITVTEKVKRNYTVAIPQFYTDKSTGESKIQLLLPLCMRSATSADLALVVDKATHRYVGKTILTLEWAYMNSRRIVKPDADWLKIS